jgi:hypothetical protein
VVRPLAECGALIEERAIRLVRLHVAGRKPIADGAKRQAHVKRRDRAFDLLIAAVAEYDEARSIFNAKMDLWRARSAAGMKAAATRRRNARSQP